MYNDNVKTVFVFDIFKNKKTLKEKNPTKGFMLEETQYNKLCERFDYYFD